MTDDLIRQLFEKETDRILEGIGRRIPCESAKAAAAGALTSGGYPSVVHDMVIEGLREAAEKRVEIEKTVWHRQAKKPGPADANACKAAIAASIEQVIPRFFSIIEEACCTAQLPQLISHFRQLFSADKTRFISEAERDVDIWVGLSVIEPERVVAPVPITYNFQNYGIVQTGAYTQATQLVGDARQNKWIIEALSEVRAEIIKLTELQNEQKSELVGALDTAIAEVNKGKPNALTIGGIITAVGSATSVLADATKAYETIKSIAGRFGVTLP